MAVFQLYFTGILIIHSAEAQSNDTTTTTTVAGMLTVTLFIISLKSPFLNNCCNKVQKLVGSASVKVSWISTNQSTQQPQQPPRPQRQLTLVDF